MQKFLRIDDNACVTLNAFYRDPSCSRAPVWSFLQRFAVPLRKENSCDRLYSLPQLVQLLVDTPYDSPLWAIRELMAVNSVESCVWDRQYPSTEKTNTFRADAGLKELPLDDLLVIIHGDNHLLRMPSDRERIDISYPSGVSGYFGINIAELQAGKFFGDDIPVFDYAQFLKESRQPTFDKQFPRYVVVLPSSIFRSANSGKNIDELAEDPLFIVRNGGERLARAHIDKIKGMMGHFEKDGDHIKLRHYDLEKFMFEDKSERVYPFSFSNVPYYADFPAPVLIKQDTTDGHGRPSLPMPVPTFSDTSIIMGLNNWGSRRGLLASTCFAYGGGLVTGNFCPLERHRLKEEAGK